MQQYNCKKLLALHPGLLLSSFGNSFFQFHNAPIRQKSHYEILGVNSMASKEEIKTAYYKLSKKYHPDRTSDQCNVHGSQDATSLKFIELTEAYEVLFDSSKRKEYDESFVFSHVDRLGKFNKIHHYKKDSTSLKNRNHVYNFDAWTKAHYHNSFERKMAMNEKIRVYENMRRKPNGPMEDENNFAVNKGKSVALSIGTLLTFFVIFQFISYRSKYDNPESIETNSV